MYSLSLSLVRIEGEYQCAVGGVCQTPPDHAMIAIIRNVDRRLIIDEQPIAVVDLVQSSTTSLTSRGHEAQRVSDIPLHHSAIGVIQDIHGVVVVDIERRGIVQLR